MPPTLHPCLKRGLDLDPSPVDSSDLVEDLPAEHHDAEHQTAKRRRVEAIALQYLRGKPPVMLTARLKGPFTKEWKNPWAKDAKTRPDGQSKDAKERAERQGKRSPKTSQVASPEASRAVAHTEEQLYSQFEPLPATAPLPDEDDLSGATEFFSVETDQFVANNSPANPFWLRRPATSIAFPANSQTDKSPTRLRRNDEKSVSRRSLQLAPPKEPLAGRPLPIRATPPDEWRSSASASMDISSPAKPATAVKHQIAAQNLSYTTSSTDIPDSSRLRADSAQEEEARSSQAAQHVQVPVAAETPTSLAKYSNAISSGAHSAQPAHAQSFDTLVPATTYKISSTVQVPQSSPTRPSRGSIQRSAERLINPMPRSATKQLPSPTDRKPAKEVGLLKKLRHNLVASPAPASSTGFMYRRVGQSKSEGSNVQRTKPRAVSFGSSPTQKDNSQPDVGPEIHVSVVEAEVSEHPVPRASAEAVERSVVEKNNDEIVEASEADQDQDEQQDSYKSRQSQYSTQAAMLLAQLEFQEDSSQSSTSSATLRPWSQPAQNTPPPLLPQPSPAITPLSVFNAHTDTCFSVLAGDSVLHGPQISTQDLFDAASPFAFSTVKKKSQRPRRTSLRFALTSKLSESMAAKSPTPSAVRTPLKEKNTPTTWGFTHEKSSLYSPKLSSQSTKRTTNDVELPQLDFHTSLDFGPNPDLTDCFLKGLTNEP